MFEKEAVMVEPLTVGERFSKFTSLLPLTSIQTLIPGPERFDTPLKVRVNEAGVFTLRGDTEEAVGVLEGSAV